MIGKIQRNIMSLALAALVIDIGHVFATEYMTDGTLDAVSASGQTVAIATHGTDSPVTFVPVTDITLSIAGNAQDNLRALVLNNVVGENQLANGINLANNVGQIQSNEILQSWGGINDTGAVSVAGVGGNAIAASQGCGLALVAVGCRNGDTTAAASSSPGVVKALSNTSDTTISTSGNNSAVLYAPVTTFTLSLGTAGELGGQTNLVALVVNNVAGLNQVANGVNLSAFGVTLDHPLTLGAGQISAGSQSNVINQYRGTPSNWTR